MALRAARGQRLMLVLLAAAVLGSAFAVVYSKHLNRTLFADLLKLQTARDGMNVEWGKLQLERATFDDHSEIERVARDRLGMVLPAPNEIEMVRP